MALVTKPLTKCLPIEPNRDLHAYVILMCRMETNVVFRGLIEDFASYPLQLQFFGSSSSKKLFQEFIKTSKAVCKLFIIIIIL